MTIFKTLIIACTLIVSAATSHANDENTGTGTVAETMTSGGYVYVLLEEDNRWVASAPIPIVVGDKVKYTGGMTMKDFTSRTLNRSFEYILFAQKLEVVNEVNAEAHASAPTNDPHAVAKSVAAVAPAPGEITPLDGGKTIVGIRAEAQSLKDQQVALRAKVMKVSENILGKNWITLQDGTGVAPDDKLLTTSQEVVTIGDVVTVKGMVKTDVDLGSGYKYKVVLEEATFTK